MVCLPPKSHTGFTLIELVLVIVLLGVIAVASTQFVQQGMTIYVDSIRRDALQQQGRYAIERISRELRNALPGSVRLYSNASMQCIEFMPVHMASTYLQPVSDIAITSLEVVDFGYSFRTNDLIAIYPIDTSRVYGTPSAMGVLDAEPTTAAGKQTLSLASTLFPDESPVRRFYIVNEPVSFCAADNALRRHQGYARTAALPSLPPNAGVLLAENIRLIDDATAITVFAFTAGTLQRSGVVHMDFRFSADGEWLRFSQDVFMRNTP